MGHKPAGRLGVPATLAGAESDLYWQSTERGTREDSMSEMFHEGSRALQDRFDTRRLADRLEERALARSEAIAEADRAFIEAPDMFFLATADAEGRPQCS